MKISDLQQALRGRGLYSGRIDGIAGPRTRSAVSSLLARWQPADVWKGWLAGRREVAAEQLIMQRAGIETGAIDGLVGPQTRYAREAWRTLQRDGSLPDWRDAEMAPRPDDGRMPEPVRTTWPRQADAEAFYGAPGAHHTLLDLPYPMRLAWDLDTTVHRITINMRCSASALRVFSRILTAYGDEAIRRLGLDLFGGCFADRAMRGGTARSMHAYACAIDIDPERNRLRWGRDRAALARPEYDAWWEAWTDEGWLSLGKARNFDWMHVQAARL